MRTLAHREITMAQPGIPATPSDRRWVILSVVAVAQLMVVLDSTIALPTPGYTLAFAVSAGVLGLGAILAVVLLPSRHRLAELRNAATAVVAPASA
jgi:hypothetical protein